MSDALGSLLRELVAIDSTSSRSNLAVVDALQPRLEALGLRCQRQPYLDEAGVPKANLLGFLGEGLPELALVGHTDCVPFDPGWTEALQLTERDGRLYGRGACDTKAFVACAVTAVAAVRARLTRPVLLCFTADEELGCFGAKKLLEAGLGKTRRAIIGEPTGLRPIRANKGYCLAEVVVRGQEGHSAYPETGRSAIAGAARLIARLDAHGRGPLRAELDPRFVPGYASLNVGTISGGRAKNVIPGECRFTLEWRPLPGQRVEAVLEVLQGAILEEQAADPAFSATVRPQRLDRGFDTPAGADVVRSLERLSGLASETVSFGTEGPQLQALGAVPVVFGPGDIQVAHQTGEFVPVVELLRAESILEAALLEFAGDPARPLTPSP
jgi:acetylornithine deacetylase